MKKTIDGIDCVSVPKDNEDDFVCSKCVFHSEEGCTTDDFSCMDNDFSDHHWERDTQSGTA